MENKRILIKNFFSFYILFLKYLLLFGDAGNSTFLVRSISERTSRKKSGSRLRFTAFWLLHQLLHFPWFLPVVIKNATLWIAAIFI